MMGLPTATGKEGCQEMRHACGEEMALELTDDALRHLSRRNERVRIESAGGEGEIVGSCTAVERIDV